MARKRADESPPRPSDEPGEPDWATFEGVEPPRYTMVPDAFFDVLVPWLSLAENRVLSYIVRHTFGYKKDADSISIEQFMGGIVTADGRRIDYGANLKRSTVLAALASLEAKNIIVRMQRKDAERGNLPSLYRLRVKGEVREDAPPGPSRQTPLSTAIERGVHEGGPPSSTAMAPQETRNQETNKDKRQGAQTDDGVLTTATWNMICAELQSVMTQDNYRHWFAQTRAMTLGDETLTVETPSPFHQQWLDLRLRTAVDRAAERIVPGVRVVFVVAEDRDVRRSG